jgi:hypothetical protein
MSFNYTIGSCQSIIVGGDCNNIFSGSNGSFIGGGYINHIGSNTEGSIFGVIGGGCCNLIDSTVANPSSFGIIAGGFSNTVCAGATHSSIFSGSINCVAGNFSVILGGTGNSDGGFNNVGIFGQTITASAANTFYVNCLNANSIPGPYAAPPGLPMGTIWYGPAGIVTAKALYII